MKPASPWLAAPADFPLPHPRRVVAESWQRSLQQKLDPESLLARLDLPEDDLDDYRQSHPLAPLLPVVRSLLLRDAEGSGLMVAIGDAQGRMLWVEGDREERRAAENILFVAGANWSESSIGTSAPGTSLVLDHGIQITNEEHFNRYVQRWSCTSVPVHDPVNNKILGFLDITGDSRAVGPNTLPLLQATVHAMESEMMVAHLRREAGRAEERSQLVHASAASTAATPGAHAAPSLAGISTFGRDIALMSDGNRMVSLSARHSELMTLLSWHTGGLSADELATKVYGEAASTLTLRAEMVRLRHALDVLDPRLAPLSRPYRLLAPLDSDFARVLALLDRGSHRQAVQAYTGPLLPTSTAPGIEEIRESIRARVRESLLSDASLDVLLDYAATSEGANDRQILMGLLGMLPPKSPRRAGIVARLEALDRA